jgi:hypothetical protein
VKKDPGGYNYLKELSTSNIVTFGEDAEELYSKLVKSRESWKGKIQTFTDKRSLFYELLKRRELREKLSESAFGSAVYNGIITKDGTIPA